MGVVTSGGYGFRSKKSLAFAYVKSDLAEASNLEIEIQGKKREAKILPKASYDPENKKLTALSNPTRQSKRNKAYFKFSKEIHGNKNKLTTKTTFRFWY